MKRTEMIAAALLLSASCISAEGFHEGEPVSEWPVIEAAYRLGAPAAAGMLERFYTLNPTDIHAGMARLMRADIDFFAHRWPEALTAYRQADIDGVDAPQRSLYSYRMALSLIKTGHFADARTWLRKVKGKEYADVRNFYNAYLDYIEGDFSSAYTGFNKVTPGIPGLDAGYYILQIDYSWGNYRKVTENADRLMFRHPVPELCAETHRICGLSYFKLDDYDQARISLSNYFDQNKGSDDTEALYAMGCIEYEEGNYGEAEKYFSPVTDDRPALAQSAWLYIGQCRLMLDDVQGATLAFEKATLRDTDPEVAQTAMYDYITSLTRGGSVPFSKSASMLEAFLQRWPDSPHTGEVEEYLASAYFNDHDYRKAVACVDAVRKPSRNLLTVKQKALYSQGVDLYVNGDAAASVSWFERAAAMTSSDPALAAQSLLWLGDAHYAAGSFSKAADCYSRFLKSGKNVSNRALGLYDLAYAQYRLGRYGDAAATFRQALDARPALSRPLAQDARIRRADCLYYSGNYRDAEALYAEAVSDKAPDSDYAAYRRAMMTGLTGSLKDKIAALDAFVSNYPDSRWLSDALLEKARTHEELGEAGLAAEAYRKRLALTPDADIDELMSAAVTGDKAGDDPASQLALIERIRRSADLSADELADIDLYQANALARLGRMEEADEIYSRLADNPSSLPGAVAAVSMAEYHIRAGKYQKAYDEMSEFTETGTPHSYWLARGFIALSDACKGIGKPELAREYLISLRDNYPGDEADIFAAIKSRLKK